MEWFNDVLGLPFEAGAEQPHPRSGLRVFTPAAASILYVGAVMAFGIRARTRR
jgi:hypothetical protein